ncbi:hypothetical protein LINPERPRIM_LOCUS3812 [Linum perenne]
MLICGSEEEVDRIIRLNRWEFLGHRIRADKWLVSTGISDVVGRRGWARVVVKRIPLHLRSDRVLQDIARSLDNDACVEEVGCNLNEVRVRLRRPRALPSGIWLQLREDRFWLPIFWEEGVEGPVRGTGRTKERDGRGRSLIRVGGGRGRSRRPTKRRDTREVVVGEVGGLPEKVGGAPEVTDGRIEVRDEMAGMVIGTCHEKYDVPSVGDVVEEIEAEEREGTEVGFQGEGEGRMEGKGEGVASLGLEDSGLLLESFWGGCLLGPILEGHDFITRKRCVEGDADRTEAGLFGSGGSRPSSIEKVNSGVSSDPKVGARGQLEGGIGVISSTSEEVQEGGGTEIKDLWATSEEGLEEGEVRVEAELVSEEEELCNLSVKIAHLFEVRRPSDSEIAVEEIVEVAKGVSSRRKKSRLEREQHRLSCGDSITVLEGGRRDVGYVTPLHSLDEST